MGLQNKNRQNAGFCFRIKFTTLLFKSKSDNNQAQIDLLKEEKCTQWAKAVESRKVDFEQMEKNSHFFSSWVMEENGKDFHYSIMFLLHWKPDMHHYNILAHELIHGISFIMAKKMDVLKENEAFAHQHSYLFNAVAKKLNEWYSRRNDSPVGITQKRKKQGV